MRRNVYLAALGAAVLSAVIVTTGGAQVYPVRLDPQEVEPAAPTPPSLVLADGGIEFPDGSVQTTAAMDVGSAARSSFRYECLAGILDGESGGECSFPAIPSGKIAVVEYFDGYTQVESGQSVRMYLDGAVFGNVYVRHQYTDTLTDQWVVSEPHRMYLDEGSILRVGVVRIPQDGGGLLQVWITGYLVDKTP